MRDFFKTINPNLIYYFSILGLIITGVFLIFSLFESINYRSLLSIPFGFFTYLFLISTKANDNLTNSFTCSIFIVAFIALSIIDFSYEHYYDKNDWKSCKGYIYDLESRTTKNSPGIIYYHFKVNNKKIESEKPISLMVNFGFKKSDSIYVVYSASRPDINDIYSLESGPKLNDRNNIVLYTIKNSAMVKWTGLLALIIILLIYFSNINQNRYPV